MGDVLTGVPVGDWCGADPFEASFRDDPYPALRGLRERDPVNLTPVGTWRISRYDDLARMFREANTSMTLLNGESPNFDPLDKRGSFLEFMLNKDDPEHQRLRRLATLSLNPKTTRLMEDEVRLTVKNSMDEALARGGMDVIPDMAHNVPSRMVCKIMGIPECDREKFNGWTAARTNAFFAKFLPPEVQQRTREAGHAMADYFEALLNERREQLGDDRSCRRRCDRRAGSRAYASAGQPQVAHHRADFRGAPANAARGLRAHDAARAGRSRH